MNGYIRGIVIVLVFVFLAYPALGNTLMVKDVKAGGIIVFDQDGFTARLTGLDVAGMDYRIGMQVWDFIKRALHGKRVEVFTLTTDNTAGGIVHDEEGYPRVEIKYGKNFAKDLNEVLLQKGYARVDIRYLPDHLQSYKRIERDAKARKVGIWDK